MRLLKKENLKKIFDRWDLEVENTHNFIVEGVVVHNSNFSISFDGNELRSAKRSGFLNNTESFYNCTKVVEELTPKVKQVFQILKERDSSIQSIILYGELYGGKYPHLDVVPIPQTTTIQKGVWYNPDNGFYAFDLFIVRTLEDSTENGYYLDYFTFEDLMKQTGIFFAEQLCIGTLEECLKYPNDFITKIPEKFDLPPIENNICEGVVIKPVVAKKFTSGERVILKNKNEKWSEKSNKTLRIKEAITMTEEAQRLLEELKSLISENRLRNVLSKIGEITNKQFGMLLGEFNKDIFLEFNKDSAEDFEKLDKEEKKRIHKLVNQLSADVIRRNFVNVVDGEF